MRYINEAKVWAQMRKNVEGHWERVENAIGAGGMPDVVGVYQGATWWVELKSLRGYERNWGLSHAQLRWHGRWQQAGGHSMVLARVAGTGPYAGYWCIQGAQVPYLHSLSVRGMRQGVYHFPGDGMYWPEVNGEMRRYAKR